MPDQPHPPAVLDAAAVDRWLVGPHVVAADGRVWSWHNPAHQGYAYPEAGGLWLHWAAQQPAIDLEQGHRVDRWLALCCAPPGIGRDGRHYLFDHAMVLAGRLAWVHRCGGDPLSLRPMVETLLQDLEARRVVAPVPAAPRWSTVFGSHLLKVALPLAAWVESTHDEVARAGLHALSESLWPTLIDGRIPSSSSSSATYLHAHCYATEGLWGLSVSSADEATGAEAHALARRAADWLAQVQRPDGGLPAWHDGRRGWGPARTDATAQAIRLWCGLDRSRHADAIERGLAFLARTGTSGGGLRYHEDSTDQNTWATLFAAQAMQFAEGDADIRRLV